MPLKVRIFTINEGQAGEFHGLMFAEKGNEQILPYSPRWKTKRGAESYAKKRGYIVTNSPARRTAKQSAGKSKPKKKK